MSEINLEFVDRTEEWNEDKCIQKLMEDWASLIHGGSAYCNTINDSSVNYLDPLDDVGILDSTQISLTFECNVDRIFGSKCSFCEESFSDKRLVRIYSKNFG